MHGNITNIVVLWSDMIIDAQPLSCCIWYSGKISIQPNPQEPLYM